MITVVIPNWNGVSLLPTCLDSLRAQTHTDFEIIVVDNASIDNSVALVETDYPECEIVVLPRNLGLTGGVNAGIRASQGEIVALLNNDAEAHPGWLAELATAMERWPDAGSAASKMLLHDRRGIINSAGDFCGIDGMPGNRGVWQEDNGDYDTEELVFGGCGGAVAYRRKMLDEVGLFDETLFMYCEDVDLGWRSQLAGWACVYVPTAIVYHRLSASAGGVTASYYTGRNCIYTVVKDYPSSLLKRFWPRVVATQSRITLDALRAWRGEAARARLRGQMAGLLSVPRALRARRSVQSLRTVSDEYLVSILAP